MIALITGASSGIGEAYAIKYAKLGYDLIITGRREKILNNLAVTIKEKYKVSVETIIVDLSNNQELENLMGRIKQLDNLEILINNAGFGTRSQFLGSDLEIQENMIKVHVIAPVKLIYAALPLMIQRNSGSIINVSSLSGRTPLPAGAIYSATKALLIMLSESLYLENMHSNVIFQVLCPGFTRTDFHKKIGLSNSYNSGIVKWMSADEVVEISLKNLRKGKVICVPGFWNKFFWFISGLLPRSVYYKIAAKTVKRDLIK